MGLERCLVAAIAVCGLSISHSADAQAATTISTCQQLQAMQLNPNGSFVLGGHIDCSQSRTWNNGAGFDPIKNFGGTLDGRGYSIRNLFINRPSQYNVGLIANFTEIAFSPGTVTNLRVANATVTGAVNVGILIGETVVSPGLIKISRVRVDGKATSALRGDANVGGLIGRNGVSLYQTSSSVNVLGGGAAGGLVGRNQGTIAESFSNGSVLGGDKVGGLVGKNERVNLNFAVQSMSANIIDSFAVGSVYAAPYNIDLGGLVGDSNGSAHNTYAAMSMIDDSTFNRIGGLAGYSPTGAISGSYWDKQLSKMATSVGNPDSDGKTTGSMRTKTTYKGWNFTNPWDICEGAATPHLRWNPIPCTSPSPVPSPLP